MASVALEVPAVAVPVGLVTHWSGMVRHPSRLPTYRSSSAPVVTRVWGERCLGFPASIPDRMAVMGSVAWNSNHCSFSVSSHSTHTQTRKRNSGAPWVATNQWDLSPEPNRKRLNGWELDRADAR